MAQVAIDVSGPGPAARGDVSVTSTMSVLPLALLELTGVLCLGLFLEVVAAMHPSLGPGGSAWAWLPVVFLPVAFAATVVVALAPGQDSVHAFAVTMALAIAVGVFGTILHMAAHGLLGPTWGRWLSFGAWLGDPPVFAPMSFGLLGLMGVGALLLASGSGEPAPELDRWGALRCRHAFVRLTYALSGAVGLAGMAMEFGGWSGALGVLATLAATAVQCVAIVLSWIRQAAA